MLVFTTGSANTTPSHLIPSGEPDALRILRVMDEGVKDLSCRLCACLEDERGYTVIAGRRTFALEDEAAVRCHTTCSNVTLCSRDV